MAASKTTEQFILEAQEIFGERYDYSVTSYKGARSPVEYICKLHGKVIQTYASNHLRGKGCAKCRILRGAETRTKSFEDFLNEAFKVHSDLYIYQKEGYVNRRTKISIKCTRCNKSFFQTPNNHISGKGCNTCNRIKSTWQKEILKKNFRKISKKYMFVYRTTNLKNGKIYIGQHSTNDLTDGYKGSGLLINKAFNKYGKINFQFEIIEFSDSREYLDQLEKKLIMEQSALNKNIGYNLHQGGLGGSSFKKINQYKLDGSYIRTWDAIIIASQELNLSYKTIQNCAREIKPSCGGFIWKDYSKYSDCKDIQPFKNNSIKSINQYSIDGKFIRSWDSITEAALTLNVSASNIGKCCGMEPSTLVIGGFVWRYSVDVNGLTDINAVVYKARRKVEQYTIEGIYLKTFESISDASKEIKGSTSNISRCCNGERKTAGGYIWKYENGT